jgi:glyoxylase-like metal-dependent hydrolase (beta-lactamase superfamily II)
MIVERSMHPGWLSNAYLVADAPGGTAVFVDTGAPLEPLLAAVDEHGVTVSHVLRTHAHADHVAGEDDVVRRFGATVVTGNVETGGLAVEAIPCPGHSDDGVSFFVNGELLFSGDTLFLDAVGGGPADEVQASVLRLMTLPAETRVLPGHTDETTIGRELEHNPFVRYWQGRTAALDEPVRFGGAPATLLVWSPDYDGKGKALVRFEDGREAIVGGSRIDRGRRS